MQNLEIWIVIDESVLPVGNTCQQPAYSSYCNKISSAYQSAQSNINLIDAFAVAGRNNQFTPVINHFNLKHFPALVFHDPDAETSFYAIDGNKITEKRIREAIELAEEYSWNNTSSSYTDTEGNNVNITDDMEKKLGGLFGGKWGLPIGGSKYDDCKAALPEPLNQLCDIPLWVLVLIVVLVLILLIKIIN